MQRRRQPRPDRTTDARTWHPRRVYTDSYHNLPTAPNLIARGFTAAAPNRVWLADVTYAPNGGGLAVTSFARSAARALAGAILDTCGPNSSCPCSQWRSTGSGPVPDSCIIPIAAYSTLHTSIGPLFCRSRHPRKNALKGRLLRQCPNGEALP
jgi:hypothetical protein